MKKVHIMRLLFVILMIVFASIWVLKFQDRPAPSEPAVEVAAKKLTEPSVETKIEPSEEQKKKNLE
jgi:uncharacterized membrane protein AbrB (regulator of aidB expression)